MTVPVEVTAEDVEAADKPQVALFVRCRPNQSGCVANALSLDVLEGVNVWQIKVKESDKPAVLACSAAEYLRVLETAFTGAANARFQFQWARQKSQLTLVEHTSSGIAMTYTRLKLSALSADSGQYWNDLLHTIGSQYGETQRTLTRQSDRITELEELLGAKDRVVETALQAKQMLEDELFDGFCTVLSTKKETILRLQMELQEAQSFPSSVVASKSRAKPPRKPKAKGAKLRKKEVVSDEDDEELSAAEDRSVEEDEGSDDDGSDSNTTGQDSDGLKDSKHRSRTQDAVDVYGALPKRLRKSTQICSANDVLDDIDAIMKREVEANDKEVAGKETQQERGARKRPPPALPAQARQQEKKIKQEKPAEEPSPPPKATARKPPVRRAATKKKPSPVKAKTAATSDEEDILDMLA